MKKFEKEIDRTNRNEMIYFLQNHDRYSTESLWNNCTSYSHDVKVRHLGLDRETEGKLLEIIGSEAEDAYLSIHNLCSNFAAEHDWEWYAGFNGRNDSHLVLYHGGRRKMDYKSRCTACSQLNYKSVEESGDVCGRCGKHARVNLMYPIYENFTYQGEAIDMDESFDGWDDEEIARRVDMVCDFDRLADAIVAEAAYMAQHYSVEEETVMVPMTRKVLRFA